MIHWKPFWINLLLPLAVGGSSAFLTSDSMEVYQFLHQPPLSPPGWLFPIVWTILYLLMGIAAYLVWVRDSTGRNGALLFYGLQLALNFVWTLIFFNLQNYGLALLWILILWVLILITTIRFFRETKAAGWLMLPYLLWVSFAVYLNAGIWLLNR